MANWCSNGVGVVSGRITMNDFWRFCWKGLAAAVLGIVMMGAGVYRGELAVVLEKAINLCLECIGIG